MARFEIQLAPSTPDELGLDPATDPTIDIDASLAQFDHLLDARVQAAYPDAMVIWSERGLQVWDTAGDGPPSRTTDDAQDVLVGVAEIAEWVLQHDCWIVDTVAGPA